MIVAGTRRDHLFVSHANPEDNEFARWISLQLVRNGYPVWCDLTKMLGGEDPWGTPEDAILRRTAKFLFVLSRTSNQKPGVMKELQVAENVALNDGLENFIIPLHIDDLPIRQANIRLANSLAVPFHEGWAQGLDQLLRVLERDKVDRSAAAHPGAVASWWRKQFNVAEGVVERPESCLSNWLEINHLPEYFYLHRLGLRMPPGQIKVDTDALPYPGKEWGQNIIAFASADDLDGSLGPELFIEDSVQFRTLHLLENEVNPIFKNRGTARRLFSELMRRAWEHSLRNKGVPSYEFADGGTCFYFTKGLAQDDKLPLIGVNGKPSYRNCVGYRTVRRVDGSTAPRYWHFGFQARPLHYPVLAFAMKTHVLFSDDATSLWDNRDKMHRARRRQCANWWNGKWRDMLLGSSQWLAEGGATIVLRVGSSAEIRVAARPLSFDSPVSYARIMAADGQEDEDDDTEAEEDEMSDEGDDDA